jgi:hypothetical protein
MEFEMPVFLSSSSKHKNQKGTQTQFFSNMYSYLEWIIIVVIVVKKSTNRHSFSRRMVQKIVLNNLVVFLHKQ